MESTTTECCSAEEEDSSDSEVACLMRVGKKSEWLRLFGNTEVTVGRGVNVTYQLLSASCPLMISRLHCTFRRKEDGQWTVTDKKSLNGVWVNGNRIPADEAHLLRPGDSIQLGVPVMGSRVEFDYVLVQRPLKDVKLHLAKTHQEGAAAAPVTESSKRKMTVEEDEPSTSKPKLYRRSSSDKSLAKACPPPLKKCQLQQSRSQPEETTSSRRVQESSQRSDGSQPPCDVDNLQMYSQNILLLREQVDDTQRRVASLGGEDQQGDPLVREQVQELQSQLGTLRAKMHQMETLKKSFSERRWPEHQKTQQEEQMRKQLNDALQEQKKVIVEHALSRQAFEKILSAKNKELEATKEKERARAQKEEVVTQMTEVLENELQCIICSELFIEAVTLNCAHSFCSYCINQWRKKKEECPICRQAITSQSRCLALDNFIERMMENLSLDVKEKRQSIINERKGEKVCESSVRSAANATEVMVIHDDDSSSSSSDGGSSSSGSSMGSDGSMLSIFSSLSSVFTVDTESSDHLEFEISDDLED